MDKIKEYISTRETKKSIIAIGQQLIERADDICKDMEDVASITIHAELNPCKIANFDVTKNYNATLLEEKENDSK